MSAPRRWIEDGGSATPLERDLLRSGLSMDPPPNAQAAVWASLLTQIPPPAGPPGGAGSGGAGGKIAAAGKAAAAAKGVSGAAAAGLGASILKSVLVGAGSAAALVATYAAVTPARRSEPPAAVAHLVAPAPAALPPDNPVAPVLAPPAPVAPAAAPLAERRAVPEPRPAAAATDSVGAGGSTAATADRDTLLRDEIRMVSETREALRRGDASRALVLTEQMRTRFPGGVLVQEREALAIEALARSGRRADASARAAAFLRAYPKSMLAERVQTFAQ
jgi:hypothetical protein